MSPEVSDSNFYSRRLAEVLSGLSSTNSKFAHSCAIVYLLLFASALFFGAYPFEANVYFILFASAAIIQCFATVLPGYGTFGSSSFIFLAMVFLPSYRLLGFSDSLCLALSTIPMFTAAYFIGIIVRRLFRLIAHLWSKGDNEQLNGEQDKDGAEKFKDAQAELNSGGWLSLVSTSLLLFVASVLFLSGPLALPVAPGQAGVLGNVFLVSPASWSGILSIAVVVLICAFIEQQVFATVSNNRGRDPINMLYFRVCLWSSSVNVVTALMVGIIYVYALQTMPQVHIGQLLFIAIAICSPPVFLVGNYVTRFAELSDATSNAAVRNELKEVYSQLENSRERLLKQQERLERTSASYGLVYSVIRDLGSANTSDEVFQAVQHRLGDFGITYRSLVFFYQRDHELTAVYAQTPFKDSLDMTGLLQLEEPIVRSAVQFGSAQLLNIFSSVDQKASLSEGRRIFKDEFSAICAPFIVSRRVVGALYLGVQDAGTYTDTVLSSVGLLAALAAPFIHNSLLFESKNRDFVEEREMRLFVEGQKTQLEGLQNMVQEMGRELKREHTLQVVVNAGKELIPPATTVIVFLRGKEAVGDGSAGVRDCWHPEIFNSPYDNVQELNLRLDDGFMGQVMSLRSRIAVNDFGCYSHANLLPDLSAIGVPLLTENELLGGIYVGAPQADAFSDADISIIQTIASQAALAIKNAVLMEQTQRQALTDGLTGLYTHRFFKEQLKVQLDDARRNCKAACLIMIDCDHFKSYNDTLGHPAGDALLQEIASILCDSVRMNDVVCRQGGDEFAIILKDCPKLNGINTAKKIRFCAEERFRTRQVPITTSIGVSCYPDDALDVIDFVQRADEVLYKAKKSGRNCVCWVE